MLIYKDLVPLNKYLTITRRAKVIQDNHLIIAHGFAGQDKTEKLLADLSMLMLKEEILKIKIAKKANKFCESFKHDIKYKRQIIRCKEKALAKAIKDSSDEAEINTLKEQIEDTKMEIELKLEYMKNPELLISRNIIKEIRDKIDIKLNSLRSFMDGAKPGKRFSFGEK